MRINRVNTSKRSNVIDSELVRLKRVLSRIKDSASDSFKVVDAQYKALLRKKIRDARQRIADMELSEVKERMLDDLRENLERGKVYYASGADVPGESVLYCSKDTLIPALNRYAQELSVPELEGVSSEEELIKVLSNLGVENDLTDPFYKAAYVDNTGEFKLLSGSLVEDLAPAIEFFSQLYLEGDPDLGEVRFQDDNDELGGFNFTTL